MMRIGALGTVPIDRVRVDANPEFNRRWRWEGTENSYKTDRDYAIRGWELWGANTSTRYLRALWELLISNGSSHGYLKATYSRNKSADVHYFNSQLVHQLASAPWVPLRDGRNPPEMPCRMILMTASTTFLTLSFWRRSASVPPMSGDWRRSIEVGR